MHHDRIVNVELVAVEHVIERVVEIDRRLRRKQCRRAQIVALGIFAVRFFQIQHAQLRKGVEMESGVAVCRREVA